MNILNNVIDRNLGPKCEIACEREAVSLLRASFGPRVVVSPYEKEERSGSSLVPVAIAACPVYKRRRLLALAPPRPLAPTAAMLQRRRTVEGRLPPVQAPPRRGHVPPPPAVVGMCAICASPFCAGHGRFNGRRGGSIHMRVGAEGHRPDAPPPARCTTSSPLVSHRRTGPLQVRRRRRR